MSSAMKQLFAPATPSRKGCITHLAISRYEGLFVAIRPSIQYLFHCMRIADYLGFLQIERIRARVLCLRCFARMT